MSYWLFIHSLTACFYNQLLNFLLCNRYTFFPSIIISGINLARNEIVYNFIAYLARKPSGKHLGSFVAFSGRDRSVIGQLVCLYYKSHTHTHTYIHTSHTQVIYKSHTYTHIPVTYKSHTHTYTQIQVTSHGQGV